MELITALIYLNMSPLHAAPFDKYLIYYGQLRPQEQETEMQAAQESLQLEEVR